MILVWALGAFAKIAIPPEIAVAIGTVITVLVGIITPDEMEAE
jgi:preprotein translocase subunit Sec61beta